MLSLQSHFVLQFIFHKIPATNRQTMTAVSATTVVETIALLTAVTMIDCTHYTALVILGN